MAFIKERRVAGGARYDVRYVLNGKTVSETYLRQGDADKRLKRVQADELEGLVTDPRGGERLFGEYAAQWLDSRLVKGRPLSPATRFGYEGLLRRHLLPAFGKTMLRRITAQAVRNWYAGVANDVDSETGHKGGPDQAAKAYRLLRAVLATAVVEDAIAKNPCTLKGAGTERARERPMIDAKTVYALADAIDPRYRAFVLLGGFGGLRTGELCGLRRKDIDLEHRLVRVERQAQEIGGHRIVGAPKSEAGVRTLALPAALVPVLEAHLKDFAQPKADGFVFTRRSGLPARRADICEAWKPAVDALGLTGLHVHDLRHHAATTVARKPGVTLKEVMVTLGHSSPVAALRYQHATEERSREVADWLDKVIGAAAATEPPTSEVVHQRS